MIVVCISCRKQTTWLEAVDRKFNTCRCAHCGGRLKPYPDGGIKETANG